MARDLHAAVWQFGIQPNTQFIIDIVDRKYFWLDPPPNAVEKSISENILAQ